MKYIFYKLLATSACLFLFQNFTNAQCTPDLTVVNTGVYPTILPAARVGVAYAQVLQFHVTKDTMVTVPIIGTTKANVDSFTIVQVNGIPNGMSFQCNTANCTIPGGGNGCADIKGTPTQKGVFPLEIIIKIKASVGILGSQTVYDTLTDYSVTVNAGVSIHKANSANGFEYSIFPNPTTNNQFDLNINNSNYKNCSLKVYNLQGVLVASQLVNLNVGFNQNKVSLDGLSKGIYLIQIETEDDHFQQKIVLE